MSSRNLPHHLTQADKDAANQWRSASDGRVQEPLEVILARHRIAERTKIATWLRSLDAGGGDINRFLPTTLANWIDERMHEL